MNEMILETHVIKAYLLTTSCGQPLIITKDSIPHKGPSRPYSWQPKSLAKIIKYVYTVLPTIKFFGGLLIASLFVFSCSSELEPGKMYEVFAGSEEGVLIPLSGDIEDRLGVFYIDHGKLYAEKVTVEIGKSPLGKTVIRFPNGEKRRFSFKEYESPKYIELPEIHLYTKPIFGVQVSGPESYGHGRGFWASYPCTYGENFALTFGRKTIDLLSMDDNVDLTIVNCHRKVNSFANES